MVNAFCLYNGSALPLLFSRDHTFHLNIRFLFDLFHIRSFRMILSSAAEMQHSIPLCRFISFGFVRRFHLYCFSKIHLSHCILRNKASPGQIRLILSHRLFTGTPDADDLQPLCIPILFSGYLTRRYVFFRSILSQVLFCSSHIAFAERCCRFTKHAWHCISWHSGFFEIGVVAPFASVREVLVAFTLASGTFRRCLIPRVPYLPENRSPAERTEFPPRS